MRNLSQEQLEEKIDRLRDLNDELAEIVSEISRICDEIGDENARRYLVAHLEIVVEQGGWLSRDMTLPQWIEHLEERLYETETDEDELDTLVEDPANTADYYDDYDDDEDW